MNTTLNGTSSPLSILRAHYVALSVSSISINIVLGLPLNGYVLWLILAGAKETATADIFALNLATSETLFCLLSAFYLVFIGLQSLIPFEVFIFSLGLLYTARPLFQCCICVEYYVGVVHPVLFLRYKPLRYRVVCVCVAWLISLISCTYTVLTYSNSLFLYAVFTQNLFLFFVMLSCCVSVLVALRRPGPGGEHTQRKTSNTSKQRAFKSILIITIVMGLNLYLYVAAIPMQCCMTPVEFTMAFTICISLALLIGFIQPLLYIHRAGKLGCFFCKL